MSIHMSDDNNRFIWHQDVDKKKTPGTDSKAPVDATPWLSLRFNTVDGEAAVEVE